MVVPPGNGFANGDPSSNNSPLQLAASTTVSQNIPKRLLIFWDTVSKEFHRYFHFHLSNSRALYQPKNDPNHNHLHLIGWIQVNCAVFLLLLILVGLIYICRRTPSFF